MARKLLNIPTRLGGALIVECHHNRPSCLGGHAIQQQRARGKRANACEVSAASDAAGGRFALSIVAD